MSIISSLQGRRVWDSRGVPTVEVEIKLENGASGRGIAPSGASKGTREALELRDGGEAMGGNDVRQAVANLNGPIADALKGLSATEQNEIDHALLSLDQSALKSIMGGNAIIATSLAVLHAGAASRRQPLWQYISETYHHSPSLPLPEIQIFGGGVHAGRTVDIQDFMIMAPGANSFEDAMAMTREVYFAAGAIMDSRGKRAGVADEGGWWPLFDSNEEALETLVMAIEKAGEKPGENIVISLDIAASSLGKNGRYHIALEDRELNSSQMIAMLGQWIDDYPIVAIEDPLGEDDPDGMKAFTKEYGDKIQVIGDDYLVTRAEFVKNAITDCAANAVLVKVNQVGTVTEAIESFTIAQQAGWGTIVSARSGETEDTTISHLAVGLNAGQLKVGSFQRSERMAKWNECLRIQDDLEDTVFVKGSPLKNTWWAKV